MMEALGRRRGSSGTDTLKRCERTPKRLRAAALSLVLAAGFLLGSAAPGLAGDQPLWIRRLVTAEPDYAWAVATDTPGNVIAAGGTGGALFGPQRGNGDAWVAKYNPRGLLWGRQFGTSGWDIAAAVATDADGNIIVGGSTNLATNEAAPFLTEYDPTGRRLWKRQLGTSGYDGFGGIAVDGGGNVVVAGSTDFFTGPSWLAKFDGEGRLLWRHRMGGVAAGVATDRGGNIIVAGGDEVAGWVTKFDSEGRRLWRRQLNDASVGEVTADETGNIVVSSGAVVAKYNEEGDLLWTTNLVNAPDSGGAAIATDAYGNIILTWGLGSSGGCTGGYTRKYDPDGQLLWERHLSYTSAFGVAADSTGDVVIAGTRSPLLGGECGKRTDALVAKYSGD